MPSEPRDAGALSAHEPGAAGSWQIPLCVPEIGGNAWKYVKECLDSGWVAGGPFVERFERAVADAVGLPHAVACSSGTAALHVALRVAGVEPDDEVFVSALSFIAPANAVRYLGAWPVFVDADPAYWQMDPAHLEHIITTHYCYRDGELRNRSTGRRARAIIPVHILGHPVDMDPILGIARRYGLAVVEDATESLGARYRGQPVGALGDIACFSFNGNKLITTGGGGMIVTANARWADQARYLIAQAKDDPVEYVHGTVGYNYRLSNLQAALGCAQMECLDRHVAAKRQIAARYAEALGQVPGITVMPEAPWAQCVYWLCTVLVDESVYGCDSRQLLARLSQHGIQARPLWQPLHRSPAFAGAWGVPCPTADHLHRSALSLPSSAGLTPPDQQRVIDVIQAARLS